MSVCEFGIDKGRRIEGGIVHEPCGAPAVEDVPGPSLGYAFHYCAAHATPEQRDIVRRGEPA